jgi:hypothetical protein
VILAKKPLFSIVANYKGVSKATGNTFTGTRRSFSTDNSDAFALARFENQLREVVGAELVDAARKARP